MADSSVLGVLYLREYEYTKYIELTNRMFLRAQILKPDLNEILRLCILTAFEKREHQMINKLYQINYIARIKNLVQ